MLVQILSPGRDGGADGIRDHTARLAEELSRAVRVEVLAEQGLDPAGLPGIPLRTCFSSDHPASVLAVPGAVAAAGADWLFVQYSPFCYGRWGLNPYLPLAIALARRRRPGLRVALMIHEPFVPVTGPKNAVMTAWQRPQLLALGLAADVVFASIAPWVQRFRAWFPGRPVVHLPVGSNLPAATRSRLAARQAIGVGDGVLLLGLFGTAHPSRLLDRVAAACQAVRAAGLDAALLYVGPDGAAVAAALDGLPLVDAGYLPAAAAADRLAAVDVYLAPFSDGVSTRRTSFMAGLQQGLATLATAGPLSDELLLREAGRSFLLAPVASPEAFAREAARLAGDPPLRRRLGEAGRALYAREFAWDRVVGRLLASLGVRA